MRDLYTNTVDDAAAFARDHACDDRDRPTAAEVSTDPLDPTVPFDGAEWCPKVPEMGEDDPPF